VFAGSWTSGFVITVTDAWIQHPMAYNLLSNGRFDLTSFSGLLLNKWALQYAHHMSGAAVTGTFVMSAMAAFYLLETGLRSMGGCSCAWVSLQGSSFR
jgi:cytochrome d ubiquinol oxidase subunit I